MSKDEAPNCHQCRYFKVSWDKRFPKGCKKFGFKGKNLPSLEVLVTTGQHCIFFESKCPQAAGRPSYVSLKRKHSTLSIMA